MSQDGHPSSRHALYVGSRFIVKIRGDGRVFRERVVVKQTKGVTSSGGASGSKSVALVRTEKEDEVPLSTVNVLTCQAFQAVGSVIKFLQVKLVRMQSSDDEVYHLFQLFEASLQFLYSLSQEKIFHERAIDQNKVTEAVKYDESLVDQKVKVWWPEDKVFYEGVVTSFNADTKEHQVLYLDEEQEILNLKTETWEPIQKYSVHNKVLCEGGVVLKLVQDIMKLPECEDSYLTACIYRLKTKALYIMLYLCGAANSSFSMNQGLDIAKSTLSEVLEVLKKMFGEELKDHPRGNLQLNAMRIADLFADDINFRSYIVLNLTESLTRVFTQPHKEFLRNWCSSERDPIEEDVHLEFDSVAAAGEILGVIPRLDVSKYTYSTSRALQTPYAHQKSSLLIKIIAHLTCFNSDTPKEEKGLLVNKFFQILQMEHPNLTNGAACSSGERAAVTFKNLHSFLAHAGSLVPEYNLQVDVNHLRLFIKKLEALVAPQVSHSRHVKEVYETSECPLHSPMVKTHSLFVSDNVDDHSEDAVMEDHTETQHNGTLVTIPQQDGSSMGVRNSFGRMATAEVDPQEEKQPKKRKNRLMNDIQVAMIRNALKDDMHWDAKTRELWAVKLSAHGSEITSKQLDNWLDYHFKRKPARARAAAKDGDTASPTSHGIHHKDIKAPATLKNCGGESSKTVTGVSPTSSSKHEHGQCVMLIDEKGQEIGQGSIYLTKGVWFKKNLEELSLCVVDVNELKVAKETELPHECDGTGSSFATAEMILSKMRVLWDSSKLLLIQQQA
ncbi:Homeodomain-containing protein [Artemisia annua]|uniref:Homeodomain-containing protein n=1 Tax=Artemisia annua TaxID=35608 RepID=A0A2U1QG48_ARTAN|nr:Homeodomain-containing protein [Artemisia annua]